MPAPRPVATPVAPSTRPIAPAHAAPRAPAEPVDETPVDEVPEVPVVDDAPPADASAETPVEPIAEEPTEAPRGPSSLAAALELALTEPDVDPDAKYTDTESRVARALVDVERAAHPDVPHYDGLRVPQKRRMLAEARMFLGSNGFAAALTRALLS